MLRWSNTGIGLDEGSYARSRMGGAGTMKSLPARRAGPHEEEGVHGVAVRYMMVVDEADHQAADHQPATPVVSEFDLKQCRPNVLLYVRFNSTQLQ
jgi:hypothetical protein